MAVTSMILAPGTMLGGYQVGEVIGIGGMAVVYRANHVRLGRPVALKVLSSRLSRDEQFRERFRREGQHVAGLDHPNIVSVYDSGEAEGHLFLAIRLVEGATLAEQMEAAPLAGPEALALLGPIADALDAAHAANLVHRDVKPQNILISDSGRPYLADFGVAKGTQTGGLTSTGAFVGSYNYAAPEQFTNQPITAATDVYSLTAVLYQCLTGQVPYPRDTDAGVLGAHVRDPAPTVVVTGPGDAEINAIFARGMSKKPAERYPLAHDLIDAASKVVSNLDSERVRAVPIFTPAPQLESDPWYSPAEHTPRLDTEIVELDVPDSAADRQGPLHQNPGSGEDFEGGQRRAGGSAGPAADPAAEADSCAITPIEAGSDRSRLAHANTEVVPPSDDASASRRDRTAADRLSAPDVAVPAPIVKPRSRRLVWIGVAVAVLVVLAGAVMALVTSGGRTPPRTVAAGPLRISYRAPWQIDRGASPVPDLFATSATVRTSGTTLTFGPLTRATGIPGAAPAALVTRYGSPDSDSAWDADGHPGRSYSWAKQGHSWLTAYVLPTTTGDLALVCVKSGTPTTAASCPPVASLIVHGVQLLAPGPDTALRARLFTLLTPVKKVRIASALRGALRARAAPAARIAAAERLAVRGITATATPSRFASLLQGLRAVLREEASRFSSLSKAARADNRGDYTRAADGLNHTVKNLDTAISALSTVGIALPAIATTRIPPAPDAPKHTASSVKSTTNPVRQDTTVQPVTPPVVSKPAVTVTPTTVHRTAPTSKGSSSSGEEAGTA